MDDHSFGQWVQRERRARRLTQAELGDLAGCSAATIRKIEADERRPSRDVALGLAVALGVPHSQCAAFVAVARGELRRSPPTAAHANGTTSTARWHAVPVPRTPLLGRERELVQVAALLRQAERGLVTLTGLGGVGKTRLSLEVANALRDDFADGVWFIDLAPVTDPARVAATIAQTFGLVAVPAQPMAETLVAFLRERHVLLVLDNLEQLIPAAALIAALLGGAPHLKVLATSRAVLQLQQETIVNVPPLPLPAASTLPSNEHLLDSPAVQLFVRCVHAVRPDFQLTAEQWPAVVDICRRLDGLPLAIELVAPRLRVLTLEQLRQRLAHRLPLATGGGHDRPARQRTLRATLDWSVGLLSGPEQVLLARLSVFVGGWSVDAASVVCDDHGDLGIGVVDGLETLLVNSLIERQDGNASELRFHLLETVREYALERRSLQGGDAATCGRHAAHYLELARRSAQVAVGPTGRKMLHRLQQDAGNIQAALAWANAHGQGEAVADAMKALEAFWTGFWKGPPWA